MGKHFLTIFKFALFCKKKKKEMLKLLFEFSLTINKIDLHLFQYVFIFHSCVHP